jgi:hypothetical protein
MRRISYPRSFYYVAGHAPAELSAKAVGRLRCRRVRRAAQICRSRLRGMYRPGGTMIGRILAAFFKR